MLLKGPSANPDCYGVSWDYLHSVGRPVAHWQVGDTTNEQMK